MNHSFYSYVQTFRGGEKHDEKATFAEAAFQDHGFPKQSTDFHMLSKYIEEKADDEMSARVFDELWYLYELKYN
ncbi:YozE family protein [Viridibacillus sp. NPDC096237]|uniref:YozE family protein n=1 Tax=Viridibacillus sp. NPDC096237 TaxID=3390721 RepID=UPI003D01BF87